MTKRSNQKWQNLFAQQAANGLSAQQFCKANKLCSKYFPLRKKQFTVEKPASKSFVPIIVNPSSNSVKPSVRPALVVRYSISSLYFDTQPSPEWLAQLLRALAIH